MKESLESQKHLIRSTSAIYQPNQNEAENWVKIVTLGVASMMKIYGVLAVIGLTRNPTWPRYVT